LAPYRAWVDVRFLQEHVVLSSVPISLFALMANSWIGCVEQCTKGTWNRAETEISGLRLPCLSQSRISKDRWLMNRLGNTHLNTWIPIGQTSRLLICVLGSCWKLSCADNTASTSIPWQLN